MDDVGPQGLQIENYAGEPRCSLHRTRGTQPDCGPHQKSLLVASYVERRGRIRAILSGLPVDKIRPQEKGGRDAANPTTRVEMAADHDRPGH